MFIVTLNNLLYAHKCRIEIAPCAKYIGTVTHYLKAVAQCRGDIDHY